MIFSRFFRTAKYNQFDYQPLYYDKRKDEIEQRVRAQQPKNGNEETTLARRERLSRDFSVMRATSKAHAKRQGYPSKMRFIIILAGLALLAYWALK